MATISSSVGRNGKNVKPDVETVQGLLNRVPVDKGGPSTPLKVDGLCWQKTTAAIERFQKVGCGFQWPDGLVEPDRRTWIELDKYDAPPVPPPDAGEGKCGTGGLAAASLAGGTSSSFLGKYVPASLDTGQRNTAIAVFGNSLDLDAIRIVNRKPPDAKGLCVVGPLPGQNTIFLSSSARELLIHELTHAWQSQHHSVPGQYMWNSVQSQREAEAKRKTGEQVSAYWYLPDQAFGEYGAEQIAEQVENDESKIIAHVRSRFPRFKDPLNTESLKTPRTQVWIHGKTKKAPANY